MLLLEGSVAGAGWYGQSTIHRRHHIITLGTRSPSPSYFYLSEAFQIQLKPIHKNHYYYLLTFTMHLSGTDHIEFNSVYRMLDEFKVIKNSQ